MFCFCKHAAEAKPEMLAPIMSVLVCFTRINFYNSDTPTVSRRSLGKTLIQACLRYTISGAYKVIKFIKNKMAGSRNLF